MSGTPQSIRIFIDADACPVKDEIYRVAEREACHVIVVAGNFIQIPRLPFVERIAAGSGLDAADEWIAERAGSGDVVVTADIPLASRAIKKGASVVAPNGRIHTGETIGATLATRNLMQDLRDGGVQTRGPAPFSPRDRSAFLSSLNTVIQRIKRSQS